MGMEMSGPEGTAAGASAGPPEGSDDRLISLPGRSPVLDAPQLGVLRRYGSERRGGRLNAVKLLIPHPRCAARCWWA